MRGRLLAVTLLSLPLLARAEERKTDRKSVV